MTECRYPMHENEKEMGTWTINLIINDLGSYHGDLTITNMNIIFFGKFDSFLNSIIDIASFETYGTDQYIVIARKNIVIITPKKSALSKRITMMTCDNNELIIDYGLLPIDSILKVLKE